MIGADRQNNSPSVFAQELFSYWKRPFFIEERSGKFSDKIKDVFQGYLTCFVFSLLSIFLIVIIDKSIIKFDNYSIMEQLKTHNRNLKNNFGNYIIPIVALIGPLVEEIMFRLSFRLNKIGVGFCFAVIGYRLIVPHFYGFDGWMTYLGAAVALGILLLTIFLFPSSILEKIKGKYFAYLFYVSAIAFALVHISNFRPLHYELLLFYPVYTLPQFFMGLCIGYIRMKHGFFSGWVLHALINLPFALL